MTDKDESLHQSFCFLGAMMEEVERMIAEQREHGVFDCPLCGASQTAWGNWHEAPEMIFTGERGTRVLMDFGCHNGCFSGMT